MISTQISFCVVLHTLLVLGCWLWSPNGFNKCEFGPAPFNREGGDSFACASLRGHSVSPSEQQCGVMVSVALNLAVWLASWLCSLLAVSPRVKYFNVSVPRCFVTRWNTMLYAWGLRAVLTVKRQ